MAVAGIAAVAGFAAFTGYQTLHVDASADRQQPATNANSETPADGATDAPTGVILPTSPDPRTGDRHGPPNGAQPSNPGQSQQSSSASS